MPLEEKKYDVEANNDWAKNVKGEHLFIDSAKSGRKGYFCIGCDKQMEAVKKKNINHRSYFRHVPVDIAKDEKPCTFSNRKYRETLATDILQRLKSIKVPNIYKYPPKGEDGAPMLLEKSKFVTAKKVKSQLTFYEDSNGEIRYGKNPDIEDRYLLIRPDVTFFDANDKPILLIELVITHKVKEEKKIKLRRLGIDTISIIVPKSSEQEIEDNFKTTKRVKWEYNGIEANTEYIRVSSGTSEGILEFDEDQRRIFEESLTCRKARLNNTLRTIKRCLQSEPYRRAEHDFESEISRIEKATESVKQELRELEERYNQEVFSEFAGEYEALELQEKEFESEQERFQEDFKGLEERYITKISDIRDEQDAINNLTEEELEDNKTEEQINREFEQEGRQLQREYTKRRAELRRNIEEHTTKLENTEKRREEIPEEFSELEAQERKEFAEAQERFDVEERNLEETVRRELDRDIRRNPDRFSKGVGNILEAQRVGHAFQDAKRQEAIYKRARELFNKGTWEKG